jgi:hypothetical protein
MLKSRSSASSTTLAALLLLLPSFVLERDRDFFDDDDNDDDDDDDDGAAAAAAAEAAAVVATSDDEDSPLDSAVGSTALADGFFLNIDMFVLCKEALSQKRAKSQLLIAARWRRISASCTFTGKQDESATARR